jgi:hypothetical protein
MKTLLAIITLAFTTSIHANLIGDITFNGEFTTNHLFNFNDPGAQPLGTFGPQTVTSVSGIFGDYISIGDILGGAGILNAVNGPTFTLSGLTFLAPLGVSVAGAGSVNAFVVIQGMQLPSNFTSALWFFDAPGAFTDDHDYTGPITLEIRAFNRVPTPDGGSTVMLMGLGLVGVFVLRRKYA